MTKQRFGKPLALDAMILTSLSLPAAWAQDEVVPVPDNKPGSLIRVGDVLSGELNALRTRGGKKGKRNATYQLTSAPHRLPPPDGLCNLETGPQTFQIITSSDAQAAQLKGFAGKEISLKVEEIACAKDAGQMSEAIVSRWSVVGKR
jgi:hypothetical protein